MEQEDVWMLPQSETVKTNGKRFRDLWGSYPHKLQPPIPKDGPSFSKNGRNTLTNLKVISQNDSSPNLPSAQTTGRVEIQNSTPIFYLMKTFLKLYWLKFLGSQILMFGYTATLYLSVITMWYAEYLLRLIHRLEILLSFN